MNVIGPNTWQTIVERAPISIMLLRVPSSDPEEVTVEYTNAAAPRVAEATAPRRGGRMFDVFPQARATEVPAAIIEVCESGVERALPDLVYGDHRIPAACFSMTLVPLPERMVALCTLNLTAQRRAEMALLDANLSLEETVRERTASLEQSNERLRNYASVAAHDLSSPLMRILNFLDLIELEIEGLSAEARDLISRAQSAACQLKERVDALLQQAIEVGAALQPTAIVIEDVTAQAIDKLTPLIDARGARIQVAPRFPRAFADADAVESILINLMKNAIVHNPASHPLVDVQATLGDGQVVIAVTDSAPVIPCASRERIFRLFHRLNDKTPGTGIGLAVSRELAEALGGDLQVEPAPGAGNRFVLSLPTPRG